MNVTQIRTDGDYEFALTEPGVYIYHLENVNGSLTVDIQHSDVQVNIWGLYTGSHSQSHTLKTIQKHSCGSSFSDVLIKGVFDGDAHFSYEGLIRIEPGAHASNAYLKNHNLVLSDTVLVDSRPYLEICADDVRCTHGSVTSGLGDAQQLYCHMRGIDPKTTEKVLVEGFTFDVTRRIEEVLQRVTRPTVL